MFHCDFCENFLRDHCPAQTARVDLNHLRDNTPFSGWRTPSQVAEQYGYSIKHILRLIRTHPDRIAVLVEDRRYYILTCSFERFLDSR